ncbi:MAG: hypothetical protein JW864_03765 [Spirochaetes bacterium]|nr:hypothetical protein [Spirochaetota bacterium]
MKTVFIKINDISEINTSKVSVYDLNNRYIDKDGKMYGLKYNRKTRKVSIIRIIRTPVKSSEYFNQMLKARRRETAINYKSQPVTETHEEAAFIIKEYEEPAFNIDIFINEAVEIMETHKHRIAGIMMNLKNSRVVSERDRSESSQLNDLFRNLEIDGILRIDKALSNYKEIKQYPRSITYYISKLDIKSKDVIDQLGSDERKMAFIYAFEIFNTVSNLYRTLLKILNDLYSFLDSINPDDSRDISGAERQHFNDAKISIENTIREVGDLLAKVKIMEDYMGNPENF